MITVHFKRPGAREVACGMKVAVTRADSTKASKTTCGNCRRTHLWYHKRRKEAAAVGRIWK